MSGPERGDTTYPGMPWEPKAAFLPGRGERTAVERLGTVRRMSRLASDDGFFFVAALDHPENYVALLGADVPFEAVVASKLELAAALAGHASALLLDPVWSLGQAIATGVLPGRVGVLAPIEQLTYTPRQPPGWAVPPRLRADWSPAKIAKLGADGVKLILFYRTEVEELAAAQRELVADLAAECRQHDLPLVVEPIWYPLPGEDPTEAPVRRRRADAVVASAAQFALLGADILKVQFPGSVGSAAERASAADAAAALDSGLPAGRSGAVPWVLLSEGAGFDDFAVQMEIVAKAGASGYIAGRAVWGDAVGQRAALPRVGERLAALNAIVRAHGRPWTAPVPVERAATALSATWYQSYGR
jgi:tagatose-1,6-bisphosphate aldolase